MNVSPSFKLYGLFPSFQIVEIFSRNSVGTKRFKAYSTHEQAVPGMFSQ